MDALAEDIVKRRPWYTSRHRAGLAILVIYFRGRGTIAVDDVDRLKG